MPITYRVAPENHGATQSLRDEFGIDPSLLGQLTPDHCRAIALQRNALQRQLQMAGVVAKAWEEIGEIKAQIEALRLEAVKAGLSRKRQIDKQVSDLELEMAKYGEHLNTLNQKHALKLGHIQSEGESERGYLRTKFQQELQQMQNRWHSKAGQLGAIDVQAQLVREEERRMMAYITGKPVEGNLSSVASRWGGG